MVVVGQMVKSALRHEVRSIVATFQNVMIYVSKNMSRIFETFLSTGEASLLSFFELLVGVVNQQVT